MVYSFDDNGLLRRFFTLFYTQFFYSVLFPVVYRNTRLTDGEISEMCPKVKIDWDGLAGLLDIPYDDRVEIKIDYINYYFSKSQKVFTLLNANKFFDRCSLQKCFEELGWHDLKKEMLRFVPEYEVSAIIILISFCFFLSSCHPSLMARGNTL